MFGHKIPQPRKKSLYILAEVDLHAWGVLRVSVFGFFFGHALLFSGNGMGGKLERESLYR